MKFNIKEDKKFSPIELIIRIENIEELNIFHDIFIKAKKDFLNDIAIELEEYEV